MITRAARRPCSSVLLRGGYEYSRLVRGRCGGPSGDAGEGGQAQVNDRGFESGVELSQFVLGAGEADLKAFDFAEPAFTLSFGDPIE